MFSLTKLKKFLRSFRITNLRHRPFRSQWKCFIKVLTKREKIAFFVFAGMFAGSALFLGFNFYLKNTEIQPAAGGIYIEGIVGSPRFINPIYARLSDVDQGLVELIFSGLMNYDNQGQIVPDLAKNYEIKEDGKVYEVYLKENLFWSDGVPLTAQDVVFTIKTIQDPDYKSPVRIGWLGVEVEKISDLGVKFTLKNPYAPFLENLTQKIIPQHIWKDISPQNFPLSSYNLKPVGSGPYKIKSLKQDSQNKIVSLDLVKNQKYAGKNPYLSQISIKFFDSEEDLIKNYKKGEIKGFSLSSPQNLPELREKEKRSLFLPRYFAVFFNPEKTKILADKNVRQALNYGINKQEIIEKVFSGHGTVIHSPILPEIYKFLPPSKIYSFDIEKAKLLLQEAGFKETENGTREKIVKKELAFQFKNDLKLGSKGSEVEELQKCLAKDKEVYPEGEVTGYFGQKTKEAIIKFQEKYAQDILQPWGFKKGTGLVSKNTRNKLNEICFPPSEDFLALKFSLTTVNQPALIRTAEELSKQWSKIGVEIEIKTFDKSQLEDIIKQRDYESLLFGEVLGLIPDPYPFWHSSQKKDPGLNLAGYQNKKADTLLQEARQSISLQKRTEKLQEFQNILIEESPALFLYNPSYLYFLSPQIKGFNLTIIADPSKRFVNVGDWYIKTKRVWNL